MKTFLIIAIAAMLSFSAAWFLQEENWSLKLEERRAFEKENIEKTGKWTNREIRPLLEAMELVGRISTILTVAEYQGSELKEETKEYFISQLGAFRSETIINVDDPNESGLITYLERSEMQSLHDFYQLHPSDQIKIIDGHLRRLGADPNQFTAKEEKNWWDGMTTEEMIEKGYIKRVN